jgi:hypothetical protein
MRHRVFVRLSLISFSVSVFTTPDFRVTLFSNHVYKIIILPTLVITIPSLEIFLFCQHNLTSGGNLGLRQTIMTLTT